MAEGQKGREREKDRKTERKEGRKKSERERERRAHYDQVKDGAMDKTWL